MISRIWTISKFTFKEAISRKVFVTFFGISTFILLLFAVLFISADLSEFIPADAVKVNSMPGIKEGIVYGLRLILINPLFGGGLFLSIFASSSFIPKMLEKGSVEIILSKPVPRSELIIGKFAGVTLMVFVNVAYFVSVLYIMIGLKFASWDLSLLNVIFTITLTFAVLYSLIILIGIVAQSSLLAMMLSYLIFFVISPILSLRDTLGFLSENSFWEFVMDILYYILPRTSELGSLTTLISGGGEINDYGVLIHSAIFLILSLLLSIIIFNKKDY